jgi:hypothetical protein
MTTTLNSDTTSNDLTSGAAHRPWWTWLVPAVLLAAVLTAQNSFLFSTSLYESGDSAADSIQIRQALRLRLLVGHYSREGFFHPGPAYLYVQAAGQWLFRDVLHAVPTPWNGQLLAVFAFSAIFTGFAVMIVYGWTRSLVAAAITFAVICTMFGFHALAPVSGWPPDMFVITWVVFLLAAASVAARQARDLWLLALSGWFLIHGYAPFLFFVPLIAVVTVVFALWPSRGRIRADLRRFFREHRRQWIAVVIISVLFAIPMTANLVLHWPGQFGKYFSYSESSKAGGHSVRQVAGFVAWFWGPSWSRAVEQVGCLVAAVPVIAFLTHGLLRRCLSALFALSIVTSVAFAYYASSAADSLSNYYIGYFYWSVPTAMLLIVALGVIQALPVPWLRAAIAVVAAVSLFAWIAFVVTLRTGTHDNTPSLPATVAADAARAHGQPLILDVQGDAWPLAVGFLLQAERSNVSACVTNPSGAYLVILDEFPCAPHPSGYHIAIGS